MSRRRKSSVDELVADLAASSEQDSGSERDEDADDIQHESGDSDKTDHTSEDEVPATGSHDTQEDNEAGDELQATGRHYTEEDDEARDEESASVRDEDELVSGMRGNQTRYRFKDYPELNHFFSKVYYKQERRALVRCKNCPWTSQTNEMARLFGHCNRCPGLNDDEKADLDSLWQTRGSSLSANDSGEYNRALAKIIVTNNLPFRLLDDRLFRTLLNKICPDWILMHRRQLCNIFVRGLSKEIAENFAKDVTKDYSLSIEFDYWKDIRRRSLLGIIATGQEGQRFLVELIDTTGETHSAEATSDWLQKALTTIKPNIINSITSDSASNCALARSTIVQRSPYKHLINHRCMAHLLNRIGIKFVSCLAMENLMVKASQMTAKISVNEKLQKKLEHAGLRRVVCSTAVRWYSDVNMLESLREVRVEATRFFRSSGHETRMQRLLENEEFWIQLDQAILVMRPLADCIALSEAKDSSLGSSFRGILRLLADLFKRDWSYSFTLEAIVAIVIYISPKKLGEDEFATILASYSLDRRSKMDYITIRGRELVLKQIAKIGAKSGIDYHTLRAGLLEEFPAFEEQKGRYSRAARPGESPFKWWSAIESSLVLKSIALRLANLKSSSANIERTFSLMRLCQGHLRTNMNVKTLRDLSRIKLSLTDSIDDREIVELAKRDEAVMNSDDDQTSDVGQSFVSLRRRKATGPSTSLDEFSQLHSESESDTGSSMAPQTKNEIIAARIPNSWSALSAYIDLNITHEFLNEESSEEDIPDSDLNVLVAEYRRRVTE